MERLVLLEKMLVQLSDESFEQTVQLFLDFFDKKKYKILLNLYFSILYIKQNKHALYVQFMKKMINSILDKEKIFIILKEIILNIIKTKPFFQILNFPCLLKELNIPFSADEFIIEEELFQKNKSKNNDIAESIEKDDLPLLIRITNIEEKHLNHDFIIEKYHLDEVIFFQLMKSQDGNNCNIIEYSALQGSVNCFKYLIKAKYQKISPNLNLFAIAGGSVEIIHICENVLNCSFTDNEKYMYVAIRFHHHDIFEWLLEKYLNEYKVKISTFINNLYLNCLEFSNYDSFIYLNDKYQKMGNWPVFRTIVDRDDFITLEYYFAKFKQTQKTFDINLLNEIFLQAFKGNKYQTFKSIISSMLFNEQQINLFLPDLVLKNWQNEKISKKVIIYFLDILNNRYDINAATRIRRIKHFKSNSKEIYCEKTLLLHCCDLALEDLIIFLISNQYNVDMNSNCGDIDFTIRNCFDSVCENCTLNVVKVFIAKHQKDNSLFDFNLPFHYCCRKDKLENFKFISNSFKSSQNIHLFDINKKDILGKTVLHHACENNKIDFMKEILNIYHDEVDLFIDDKFQNTPYFSSICNGSCECFSYFINNYNDILPGKKLVNESNICFDDTALHIVCKKGHLNIFKILVVHPNIEINMQNMVGALINIIYDTPLHIASAANNELFVYLLLYHQKIDINIQNIEKVIGCYPNKTPLHIACEKGNIKIIDYFLKRTEINVNLQNISGMTPLHIACKSGNIEIVKMLLSNKEIKINLKDVLNILIYIVYKEIKIHLGFYLLFLALPKGFNKITVYN